MYVYADVKQRSEKNERTRKNTRATLKKWVKKKFNFKNKWIAYVNIARIEHRTQKKQKSKAKQQNRTSVWNIVCIYFKQTTISLVELSMLLCWRSPKPETKQKVNGHNISSTLSNALLYIVGYKHDCSLVCADWVTYFSTKSSFGERTLHFLEIQNWKKSTVFGLRLRRRKKNHMQ